MIISIENVQKLGKLSRIAISSESNTLIAGQLSSILGLIETMQAVDTTGIAPLAHPTAFVQDMALRLRCDVVSEAIDVASRDIRMLNAPAVQEGYFLVPRVLE
jgi:aspartyl-tRNA(Asn)/glutamyl-tRNA(Gln) amidotransferase subunit C